MPVAVSAALPDFVVAIGEPMLPAAVDRLRDRRRWPPRPDEAPIVEHRPAPTVRLWTRGTIEALLEPVGGIALGLEPQQSDRARHRLAHWAQRRSIDPDALAARGRFVQVLWNGENRQLAACTDLFRTIALHFHQNDGLSLVASDLRLLLATGHVRADVDHRALYHYLNLSYVPAPHSPIANVRKIPAGHCLEGPAGGAVLRRTADVEYPEDLGGDLASRTAALRAQIIETVRLYRPPGEEKWGTFLSGGTDSSSVAGILANAPGRGTPKLSAFSIGFAEQGYDELDYVQIAARHFDLDSHRRLVDEAAAVAAIPRIAAAFDEPFGNASAIPTLYCASMAAEAGVSILIAGDGGDEIFGGNERYRKDAIYGVYHRAPAMLKSAWQRLADALQGVDTRYANRVRNFVHRGGLPNPDRFYTDDAFASEQFAQLLTPEFAARVGRDDTLQLLRDVYARAPAGVGRQSELNRLLYLDLNLTIADNDVVKVVKASAQAGVNVLFPYLDRALVQFTGRLPARDKVRGLQKRFLFKRAMKGIVPDEILRKKKQGFGLPISVWLRSDGPLRQLTHDVLFSPRAAARGWVQPAFVRSLIERHSRGAWDHSAEIYQLLMLELWMREYVDD